MTVPMIKSIGDIPYPIDTHSDTFSPLLTAGAALGITGEAADSAAWLQRVSTTDGPTTIRSIHGNTIVQDGELVPVNMTGIETTGFNQIPDVWEKGYFNASGEKVSDTSGNNWCVAEYAGAFPDTTYYVKLAGGFTSSTSSIRVSFYDGAKQFISRTDNMYNQTFTTPSGARYFRVHAYFTTAQLIVPTGICINLSDPARNGTYEPYWQQTRTIPAGILRSAGSVYDELTETERITRVVDVDLGTLTWRYDTSNARFNTSRALPDAAKTSGRIDVPCGKYTFAPVGSPDKSIFMYQGAIYVYDSAYTDAAAFKAAMSGVMAHYALATPTVTPYDPPLNLTYRTAAGGTERVIVPTGENSAPPTLVTAQGYTAESLRDAALSCIAPVENGLASTNYGIGSYLVHGGQLCRVTTAIASGEAIAIGTNVTATTVMAEVIALIAQ